MIENTWNVSTRNMFNLHRKTHRYIIEPISRVKHIKFSLLKRFLKFSNALASSSKCPVQTFFHKLKRDCSSTTGSNLRRIMRLVGKDDINNMHINDINYIGFCPVRNEDEWRIMFIKELLDARSKHIIIDNFDNGEILNILDHVCIS